MKVNVEDHYAPNAYPGIAIDMELCHRDIWGAVTRRDTGMKRCRLNNTSFFNDPDTRMTMESHIEWMPSGTFTLEITLQQNGLFAPTDCMRAFSYSVERR